MGPEHDNVRGQEGGGAGAVHFVHPEGQCDRVPVPPREEREGDQNALL